MMPVSKHAQRRMGQRSVRSWQLDYAKMYGKTYNRAGAEWWVVRWKDIPPEHRDKDWAEKTVGLVVCIEDDVVSTVYYRDSPSRHIRCKRKHAIS